MHSWQRVLGESESILGLKLTKEDDIGGVDPHLLPQLAPGHIKDTIRIIFNFLLILFLLGEEV